MDVLVLIDKLDDLIHNARPVPLTDQVRVDREEIYDLLDQMRATIPEEIKQARWIVKERQEMLAEAKREAERIVKEARDQQARLISEEEVYKQAERAAEEIVEDARETERQIRLGAEDYADEILSTLEVNLQKFLAAVQRGRDRLAGPRAKSPPRSASAAGAVGSRSARRRPRPADVRAVLAERWDRTGGAQLTQIPGGASRETFAMRAAPVRWVLRRDPPGATSLVAAERRVRLISRGFGAGRPRPRRSGVRAGRRPLRLAGSADGPRRGYLGRSPHPAQAEFESARAVIAGQLGQRPGGHPRLDRRGSRRRCRSRRADPALAACEFWEAALDEIGEPLPAVELGLRWLRANAPEPAEPRLVHGDFRLGNFIVDRGRPRGGDRLGARPPRRSGRGHRLALHPLLAVRQRRPPGGGRGGAR